MLIVLFYSNTMEKYVSIDKQQLQWKTLQLCLFIVFVVFNLFTLSTFLYFSLTQIYILQRLFRLASYSPLSLVATYRVTMITTLTAIRLTLSPFLLILQWKNLIAMPNLLIFKIIQQETVLRLADLATSRKWVLLCNIINVL